jgi:hypothetical protein
MYIAEPLNPENSGYSEEISPGDLLQVQVAVRALQKAPISGDWVSRVGFTCVRHRHLRGAQIAIRPSSLQVTLVLLTSATDRRSPCGETGSIGSSQQHGFIHKMTKGSDPILGLYLKLVVNGLQGCATSAVHSVDWVRRWS